MVYRRLFGSVAAAMACWLASGALAASPNVTLNAAGVPEIDGRAVFPISLAVLPSPDAKTPDGKSAWQEFADAGVNFARIIPGDKGQIYGWNDEGFKVAHEYMDTLASAHLYAWLWLGEDIAHFGAADKAKQEKLKKVIEAFKDDPALAFWKGEDEPLWGEMNSRERGKKSPEMLELPYKMIHELDPRHPVIVIQAPRGTVGELAAYRPVLDVTGMDVFPIGYPPGTHVPNWPNKEISMVGDWTKIIVKAAGGTPVWMTLQISWSGVAKKGKTIRFPTFAQERFMTYEAIIDGARGVNYFGGANRTTLNERDEKLGFNWTFWDRILKPLLTEINGQSPLHEALLAPDSKLPVKVSEGVAGHFVLGAKGIEFTVREVGNDIYILACKRQGDTEQVTFSGLPASTRGGDVLYEEPRKVQVKDGAFTDWFAPFDVHVYRLTKQ